MFGLKNHVNDLQYSQRFYYTNYEFYNDYDNSKNYLNDISKVFHSCRRKTIPTVIKYHQKSESQYDEKRTIRLNANFTEQQTTMEQFLQAFTNTFQQNNYSDFSQTVQEQRKNTFRIVYFPSEVHMRMQTNITQKKPYWKKSQNSFQIINVLLDIQKQSILHIMQLNQNEQISNEELDYYRYLLGFSQLAYLSIYTFLKKDEEGIKTVYNFNAFRVLIEDIISSVMDGETCSYQILYIPNVSMFSYFLNPALCSMKNFLIKSESYSKSESSCNDAYQQQIPRIVFINLDGMQNPLNLQYLRSSYSNNLLYVTIFKQFEDINEVNDEVSNWYSKFLAKLIYNCNHKPKNSTTREKGSSMGCPKVMAFPLSSPYVKSKYQNNNQYDTAHLSGTSIEISFLFQNSIYQQIRLFNPHIVFISYNGTLGIQQNHFNEIVRRLTVLSDHKIIIFPNLTNLFAKRHHLTELIQLVSNPQNKMEVDLKQESEVGDLINIAKFVEECSSFEITDIDVNQFFNNLAMFNKISSGAYSFNQKRITRSYQKFQVQYKFKYMEMLAKLDEFSYLQKYCSQNVNVNALGKLLHMQRDALLKSNKEEAGFFAYFIDHVITIMLEKSNQMPTKLRIRLVKLQQTLAEKQKDISAYLENKKKSILVECISRQKIKKVFTIPKNLQHQPQLKDILALELYLINSKGDKQKILLDGFSQVIIDPLSTIIICTNYIDKMFNFCYLYGFIQPGKKEVEMYVLKREGFHNLSCLYFQYSTYFCETNGLLYMYWPYEWNILEETASLLLDIKYEPKIIHKMLVISYKTLQPRLQNPQNYFIQLTQHKLQKTVKPRFGSAMFHSNGLLYIFGGYYDDKDDFNCLGSGVSIARMDYQNRLFAIQDIGKDILTAKLRPKANYRVQKVSDKLISLEGGYGREFTNYYNVYSYNRYIFNLQTHYLQLQPTNQRKLNSLSVPMSNKKFGRYQAITFQHDAPQPIKLANSRKTKHRFIMSTDQGKVLSFINDEYTTTTHKQESRTEVLFDIHRKIANIYTHTHHSPQIFIRRNNIKNEVHNNILRVELLTHLGDKSSDYIASNIVFPSENSIISMGIHSSNHIIYILAQSPHYSKSVDTLYEAKLDNVNDILERKEILFRKYFQFTAKYYNVKNKSVVCIGGVVGVFGGEIGEDGYREDYIVDSLRGVTRAKAIKFICEQQPQLLTMNHSYIICNPHCKQDQLMLYSLYLDSQNHWQLKLQQIKLSTQKSIITISHLTTCTIINNSMCQFHPELKNPRIVSIQKYYILNVQTLKKQHQLLLNRINQIIATNQYFIDDREILQAMGQLLMDVVGNLAKIYQMIAKYGDIISFNVSRYQEYPELQQYVNDLLCSVVTLHLQQICLKVINCPEEKELYRFYIQDIRLPLVKYIGISELNTNSIVFFRIKFDKKVGINLKNYSENNNKKLGLTSLYGCNLAQNELNKLIFSDEQFMDRFTEGKQGSPIQQIDPFEAEVQQYQVAMQMHVEPNLI